MWGPADPKNCDGPNVTLFIHCSTCQSFAGSVRTLPIPFRVNITQKSFTFDTAELIKGPFTEVGNNIRERVHDSI